MIIRANEPYIGERCFSSCHAHETKKKVCVPIRDSSSHAGDETRNIIHYFFIELKTFHLSYSISKHDANYIADPSSMPNNNGSLSL